MTTTVPADEAAEARRLAEMATASAKPTAREEVDTPEVQSLEQLINLGRIERDVKLFGLTFSFHTLPAEDSGRAMQDLIGFFSGKRDGGPDPRIPLLAKAITHINGIEAEKAAPSSLVEKLRAIHGIREGREVPVSLIREAAIGALQPGVLDKLFQAYLDMLEESRKVTGADSLGNLLGLAARA